MTKKLVFAAGVLILIIANLIIFNREKLINKGDIVLLELAPVDPRSLMQGDYMALRFHIENSIDSEFDYDESANGYVVLKIDKNNVGKFIKIYNGNPILANEIKMQFRIRKGDLKFATNAYFFQEGDGHLYEDAQYGEFRVKNGTAILTGLLNEDFEKLGENKKL